MILPVSIFYKFSSLFLVLLLIVSVSGSLDLEDLSAYKQLERQNPDFIFEESFEPVLIKQNPDTKFFIFHTPWNPSGAKYAQKYASKLDYVSPCWYEMALSRNSEIVIEHDSHYDRTHVRHLKDSNPNIKILPRVYLPGDRIAVLQALGNPENYKKVLLKISEILQLEHIDGIVWDTPYNMFAKGKESQPLNRLVVGLIEDLHKVLHSIKKLLFVNMAFPTDNTDPNVVKNLKLDGLLIQNYADAGHFTNCIDKTKKFIQKLGRMKDQKTIVIIIPFFSITNDPAMISTQDALKKLQDRGVEYMSYNQKVDCCEFGSHGLNIWVPCYNYFSKAFEKAKPYAVGFWEGGNGLEIYYSFL